MCDLFFPATGIWATISGYSYVYVENMTQVMIHIFLTGSRRVFSGSGNLPKHGSECGQSQNILTGNGIWLLTGKQDSTEFGHRMWDFPACLLWIQELVRPSSWCESARQAYSGVSYISQSKLCKLSSNNEQMSRQKMTEDPLLKPNARIVRLLLA